MAKVTAPLFGFDARGQLGKALVFADWKGRQYARRFVIPANPKSTEQTLTRDTFDFLNSFWRFSPAAVTDAYKAAAEGKVLTDRNSLIQNNLTNLRTAADLALLLFSPGARSGLPATSITLTAGSQQITVDLAAPGLPTGWTIANAWAAAIVDADPQDATEFEITSGSDDTSPYQIVLTGLTADTAYRVGGWFTFTRPDGQTAYGVSISDVATPTA